MKNLGLALGLICAPLGAVADVDTAMLRDVVDHHILPRYSTLAERADALADAAEQNCAPDDAALRDTYHSAFDAWIAVSHLRFGPSEVDNRAFALAFWPDSRGATPKTLAALIADADPVGTNPQAYADVSIAGRGFFALEFLLFDEQISTSGDATYRCDLVQTVTADIATQSHAILDGWTTGYADAIAAPAEGGPYRSTEEAAQELYKALNLGLEFTADTRIGRPMGSFDRPRPKRAEAWRSGRSLRNVEVALISLQDLAQRLAAGSAAVVATFDDRFDDALTVAGDLGDPVFAGTATPQSRLRIEVLQQSVAAIREVARDDLGPQLGVASGFNALDGD